MQRLLGSYIFWVLAFVVCLLMVLLLLLQARRNALEGLTTWQARRAWSEWRSAAEEQASGEGPVLRRAPESEDPPGLVLLRDHFAASLVGLMLLTSALFFTIMAMVRGVMEGPRFEPAVDSEESPQD